jgi:hypothetical protein
MSRHSLKFELTTKARTERTVGQCHVGNPKI